MLVVKAPTFCVWPMDERERALLRVAKQKSGEKNGRPMHARCDRQPRDQLETMITIGWCAIDAAGNLSARLHHSGWRGKLPGLSRRFTDHRAGLMWITSRSRPCDRGPRSRHPKRSQFPRRGNCMRQGNSPARSCRPLPTNVSI